jgi:hypothetical protein
VLAAQLHAAADANPRRVSRSLLLCCVRVGAAERQAVGPRNVMTNHFRQGLLITSLLLNGLLVAMLGWDWIQHRRNALGRVSTSDAVKSIVSTKLLPRVNFEVRVAEEQPSAAATTYTIPVTGETFYASGQPILTNGDIESASAVHGQFGEPALHLVFTPQGAVKLQRATEANVRRRLLFIADGQVLMAPVIVSPIGEGETTVSGSFTEDEVKRIALALART